MSGEKKVLSSNVGVAKDTPNFELTNLCTSAVPKIATNHHHAFFTKPHRDLNAPKLSTPVNQHTRSYLMLADSYTLSRIYF